MQLDAFDLSLVYPVLSGPPVVALDHVNLTVRTGDLIGVLGPSGSGKSTLLYLLAGLKKPSSGAVFLDNQDLASHNDDELERRRLASFGFIFQRHYLLTHLDLLDNILLPVQHNRPQAAEKARQLAGELGLDVDLKRRPHELSVGQRQLVAVARALINDPVLIFAGEPTASLDSETGLRVMDCLARQLHRAGMVVVTHDFKLHHQASEIHQLRDGRILA